jgi:DNA mismatch repair protein MutL
VQLHNAFIVAETPDGLIVVDQHALHERILYEQLKGKVEHGGLPGQRLLLPDRVEMSPRRAAALAECRELLARLGIEVDDFGNGTAAVQTFPTLLKRADPARFVGELLDGLSERDGRATPEMLLHAVIDMAACKAAVKAGDPLTPGEIDALLARREAVENHHTCAHGRPTTLKLTVRELERQFKRH